MIYQVMIQEQQFSAQEGTNLLAFLRKIGYAPGAPCGGKGTCGKCTVLVNGHLTRSCQYEIGCDISVELAAPEKTQILISGAEVKVPVDPVKAGNLAAFDIGTTTVVCYLMNSQGEEIAVESMLNPQQPYGADVISRIRCALDGEREALTDVIRTGMQQLLTVCCHKAGIEQGDIGTISVVGNPCMQQLFLGLDVRNLAAVPFDPIITEPEIKPAKDIFPECENAVLLTVPDISGYVGADTLGCILAARLYDTEKTTLMVDIGTNGEMVLAHKGRMIACSTAAGPALEGANIQFGMRGCPGAIDHVTEDGCTVIGGGKALGICGSGLIDAIGVMLRRKLLNKRGRILTENHSFSLTDEVYLSQDDVRQVQMAKGAIAAGICLMAEYLGIDVNEIETVLLAGAFGSFMNPDNTCRIGLLPESLGGRIEAAGNIAGSGSKMIAVNKGQLRLAGELIRKIEFLELAKLPSFQRNFALNMAFREE